MMKYIPYLISILALVTFLSGCINPFSGDEPRNPSGSGTIVVSGDTGLGARTVVPDYRAAVDRIGRYDIVLSRAGYRSRSVSAEPNSSGELDEVSISNLAVGEWKVTVAAMDEDGDVLIATGTDTMEIAADSEANVAIRLSFLHDSGEGRVRLVLDLPDRVSTIGPDDWDLTTAEGADARQHVTLEVEEGTPVWRGTAPAGRYAFSAVLRDDEDRIIGRISEMINVAGNLPIDHTITVAAAELSSAPAAPASASFEQGQDSGSLRVSWSDSGALELGYELERRTRSLDEDAWSDWDGVTDDALPAADLSYTDNGVTLNTTNIQYRVRGINDFGAAEGVETRDTVPLLSRATALVYANKDDFNRQKDSYSPPTAQEIFDSWGRFDGSDIYGSGTSADGGADDWQLLESGTDNERISMPTNITPYNGIFSDEELDTYTFEATLASDDTDDDTISLIMAYTEDDGTPYTLSAARTGGGATPTGGWGVVYTRGVSDDLAHGSDPEGSVIRETDDGEDTGGWDGRYTRVKIRRAGDVFTVWHNGWHDSRAAAEDGAYLDSSQLTIDLADSDDDRLHKFRGARSYGYGTYSQSNSTYYDIVIDGGLDAETLVLLTDGGDSGRWSSSEVWTYDNSWTKTGRTVQEEIGFLREVRNPETDQVYLVTESDVRILE